MNKLLSEETEVRRSVRKKKELKANTANAENSKNVGNKCSEKEAVCELCGNFYPHPVTYHMRQAHPGCGGHAGGNGYNSGGNYCVGWAGNCGDGGLAGSSWYIICNSCREKYLEIMKRATAKKSTRKKSAKLVSPSPTASGICNFTICRSWERLPKIDIVRCNHPVEGQNRVLLNNNEVIDPSSKENPH